jgi:pimeloyl-ACP methyl ester carboxylesterase
MTRAQRPDGEIDYASSGAPGARDSVIVLRVGSLATVDPDPTVSAGRGLHVLLVHLDAPELDDPPVFGGETPAGSTVAAIVQVAAHEHVGDTVALVAEGETTGIALTLAAQQRLPVRRLVLVDPVRPAEPLAQDLIAETLRGIDAETLVVAGAGEPDAIDAAGWFRDRLAHATLHVAEAGEAPEGRLALDGVWTEVVDFLTVAAAT